MNNAQKKTETPSDRKATEHSEEVNMNDQKGYNEINEDAPVNPDQVHKKEAEEMERQLPSAPENK